MSSDVFSNFSRGVSEYGGNTSVKVNADTNSQLPKPEKKKGEILKTVMPYVIPLAAIPAAAFVTHKISTRNTEGLKREILRLSAKVNDLKAAQEQTSKITEEAVAKALKNAAKQNAENSKNTSLIWAALLGITGYKAGRKAEELTDNDKLLISDAAGSRIGSIANDAAFAKKASQTRMTLGGNNLITKYTENVNGIQLLKNSDALSQNKQKYAVALDRIKNSARAHLFYEPSVKPITKEHPTVWSITSEFAPVKEGGLGSVPVEIQNNVTRLGIKLPTFIPMYQQKGTASFMQDGDNYTYTYKGKKFNLEKAATYKIDSFQDGKSKSNDIEIYVSTTTDEYDNEKKLVFVKNDDYFNGTIYQTGEKAEEPEKFAFFSKAVYEFAKAKIEPASVKDLNIVNRAAFDSIEAPDALILNDWQASPVAALARYKAPMENAYSQLSDEASEKLSKMNIITIGHNAMYQGSTRNDNNDAQRYQSTTNILNTLFDGFSYDIVSNAETGIPETDPDDEGLKNLDNVLLLNKDDAHANHTNLLNMGICLSDYFHPVSQNYADELVSDEHPELSGELRRALTHKAESGGLVGIINGNDFNNLSIEARKGQIKLQTGIEFETYSKLSDTDDIISARNQNKADFYNGYMRPFSLTTDEMSLKTNPDVTRVRELTSKLEFVKGKNPVALPELTDEEIINTPIISSVGRLVSQKGIDVMCDAVKLLYKNWDKDFPGKPKPIFYIAGQDGEGGVQRKYIENLRDKGLSKDDASRVIFAHGFAPMAAITASSDFFLLPSKFEPCGLTQGEAFALATPVIGSAVGGIVDTVNRNGKHNGVLTDKDEKLTAESFYKAMRQGLDIFFNDKDEYKTMVKDSLTEDFSWIQKGKQGPVFDYLEKIGINKDSLPEVK